jgi:hypothetical protein
MKPSQRKRLQRQQTIEKKKQCRRARGRWTYTHPLVSAPFVFEPKMVLHQPNTWLLYQVFEKPLKTRLDELVNYEIMRVVFPSFSETILKEYLIEVRLRFQFKRLLNAWLRKRMDKKSSDFIDPITLNPILHPIRVYDVKQRRSYVFEADSLNKAIKKNLYAHQYTVPGPKKPINILTNRPFTYAQLVSIHDQLLSTRTRMEDFASFRKLQFKLETWKMYMYNHIYLAAIKEELYNYQSLDGHDMLDDFIKDMMLLAKIPMTDLFELVITNAISWYPEHPLLQNLRSLCFSSYESNTYQLNVGLLIMNRFINVFRVKCSLWDQVTDRMQADSDAEQEMEAADVMMSLQSNV